MFTKFYTNLNKEKMNDLKKFISDSLMGDDQSFQSKIYNFSNLNNYDELKVKKGVYMVFENVNSVYDDNKILTPIYIGQSKSNFKKRLGQYRKKSDTGNTLNLNMTKYYNCSIEEAHQKILKECVFICFSETEDKEIIKLEHLLIGVFNTKLNDLMYNKKKWREFLKNR